MRSLLNRYPSASRFVLAILLFALALVVSTVIDSPFFKANFPYLSVVLLLIVTWFLLKLDGDTLAEIGLNFKWKNLRFLPLGLLIGAAAFLAANIARSFYTGESISLSANTDYEIIFTSFYFILPTVAVEEFLFRGYLFKKTITASNVVVANIVFAILFTMIHVLDDSVLSSPGYLMMLLISIPVGHLLFATALLRSGSLFFPIGLHLGNNWATRHLISDQADGQSILVVLDRVDFNTWPSFIGLLLIYNGVFLLVALLIWKWGRWSVN